MAQPQQNQQSAQRTYRSEIYIPIKKDTVTFADRQKSIWEQMEERMSHRRSEWEQDIERMRRNFFTLAPMDKMLGPVKYEEERHVVPSPSGAPLFKVEFDVKDFAAEEIKVITKEQKVIVQAKHVEKRGNSTVTKEFSKEIEVPPNVDPHDLKGTITSDGVLIIEAQVSAPSYQAITSQSQGALQASHSRPLESSAVQTTSGSQRGPIITAADGSRKLHLQFPVGDYKPDEVVVKTHDRKLIIHALHDEKTAGRSVHREFNKEYELPQNVDPLTVSAYMTEDGNLTIEAPLKAPKRDTPITYASTPKYILNVTHSGQ
ncbi:major egg antigen isoform X2 [Lingula anatina]|nr:major egg antigen isoform X2 [Lingula anatina]|eukprot:XP_013416263.1 major egg antigen isoform X2 [Lingula anatina]